MSGTLLAALLAASFLDLSQSVFRDLGNGLVDRGLTTVNVAHRGLNVGVAHGVLHRIDVAGLFIERGPQGVAQIVIAEFRDLGLGPRPPRDSPEG